MGNLDPGVGVTETLLRFIFAIAACSVGVLAGVSGFVVIAFRHRTKYRAQFVVLGGLIIWVGLAGAIGGLGISLGDRGGDLLSLAIGVTGVGLVAVMLIAFLTAWSMWRHSRHQ